jgi:hypothetical protein
LVDAAVDGGRSLQLDHGETDRLTTPYNPVTHSTRSWWSLPAGDVLLRAQGGFAELNAMNEIVDGV